MAVGHAPASLGASASRRVFPAEKLGAAVQCMIQCRRTAKAFRGAVDAKAHAVQCDAARAWSDASQAVSGIDARLGFSERIAEVTRYQPWSDASQAFSGIGARLGFSESVAEATRHQRLRVGCGMAAATDSAWTLADARWGISERWAAVAEEVSEDISSVRAKACQLRWQTEQSRQQAWLDLNKALMRTAASAVGSARDLAMGIDPKALCFYDARAFPGVAGYVALTIDDAPCRPTTDMSMLQELRGLLAENNASATFFLCTDYVPGHESDLVSLLQDGHEVANHCGADRSYSSESEHDFEEAFLRSEQICEDLRRMAKREIQPLKDSEVDCIGDAANQVPEAVPVPRWFRAPHADMSPQMQQVLDRHGFTNVLCDSFANDTVITDPEFISNTLLSLVHSEGGSIIVIHTPEKGFREHNFKALKHLLAGLRERGLQAVTLSQLSRAARDRTSASGESYRQS